MRCLEFLRISVAFGAGQSGDAAVERSSMAGGTAGRAFFLDLGSVEVGVVLIQPAIGVAARAVMAGKAADSGNSSLIVAAVAAGAVGSAGLGDTDSME